MMTREAIGLARRREQDCRIARIALERWLAWLNPLRWTMVSATTILSALAAASILGKPILLGSHYEIFAGLCALGSAILSGLHSALGCDAHQAECRHLIAGYSGLEAGFQAALTMDDSGGSLKELESQYEQIIKTATASAPRIFERRARIECGRTTSSEF